MSSISFSRQQRYDGGIRTGVAVNDATVFQCFQPGAADRDPALLWYVDVVFDGDDLPAEADAAREWLLSRTESVKQALSEAAGRLSLGVDADETEPFTHPIADDVAGVYGQLYVSAVRRLADGELAAKLNETARQWETDLRAVQPSVAA